MLFKPIVRCPHRETAPVIDGDLSDWAGISALPALGELDGEEPFAEVFVVWGAWGLGLAHRCRKPQGTVTANRRRPHAADGLQVWVDTRATQTSHRATRFCHHFVLLPRGGGGGRSAPIAWQANIRRARERAPLAAAEDIRVAAAIGEGFYTIEALLPAHVLNGFEAREGVQLGFHYFAHDIPGGRQLWAAPPGFAMDTDPSLWGLLELGG